MDADRSTADRRSLDAELSSEQAAREVTAEANLRAVELHQEAAKWCRRAGLGSRAERHETYATVHAQLAARLADNE